MSGYETVFEGFIPGDPAAAFELQDCFGEGTYGAVWKAKEKSTGKIVAIKVVPIDDDLEEIKLEIGILQKCITPYIVRCYGAYEGENDYVWIVMELCEAGSVNDLMFMCNHTMSSEVIRHVTAAVLLGLSYLHEHNFIHRDVKAGNILLAEDGRAQLADFGVSAVIKSKKDRRRTAIGAPFWMAPEVINEEDYDGRCDVWSLGITVIEMAEARPPHSEMNPMRALFMIPYKDPPTLKEPESWSPEMNDFIAQCLVKDMELRPTSTELLEHPYVRDAVQSLLENNGMSPVVATCVKESLGQIKAFRKKEGDWDSSETTEEQKPSTIKARVNTIRKSLVNKFSIKRKKETLKKQGYQVAETQEEVARRLSQGINQRISARLSAGKPGQLTKSVQNSMDLDSILALLASPAAKDQIKEPSPMLATVMTEHFIKQLKVQMSATQGLVGDVSEVPEEE